MYYRTDKFTPFVRQSAPPPAPTGTPMYSSPWMALYLYIKANLNRNSTP
jgi:hypothetical protein